MDRRTFWHVVILHLLAGPTLARADSPAASYIFPAGGQRGTTVSARVGGLNLNSKAGFEILGSDVETPSEIRRTETTWFEGPLLPLPDSQQSEDYPKDYAAEVKIAADAPAGPRAWRVWTCQGAANALPFVIGEYPEIVEHETSDNSAADPVPVALPLPVTINGRIFPREDVDAWSLPLTAGEVLTAKVDAGRLGSPLDPWMEAFGPGGQRLAELDAAARCDGRLAFLAPVTGIYTVKISDVTVKGSQSHVYRLTLTTGPSIDTIFPLGGRRGETVESIMEGLGLPSKTHSLLLATEGSGSGFQDVAVAIPEAGSTVLEVDDLAEATELEPNNNPAGAKRIDFPGVGNGRIGKAGDIDVWAVTLTKDLSYLVDLRAARLGSRLDGQLRLIDATGKELARAEGTPARGGDPFLTIKAPETGVYYLHVSDRFRSRGGPRWAYRLRVTDTPSPDYRLVFSADTLTIPRGGELKWKVDAERIGGFAEPIAIEVDGLPAGVSFPKAVIAANEAAVELAFKADAKAPIRSTRIVIRGTSKIGNKDVNRTATLRGLKGLPPIDNVRLAVAFPTPFKIVGLTDFGDAPRGFVRHRRFRIERNGFSGPLEIRLADRQARHLQGVKGSLLTLPANAVEFGYRVTLPPWMEVGRTSRTVVTAAGIVRDNDGTEYEVNYSSHGAELQVIAVIGPGLLGLEASRDSLPLAPGRSIEVGVKLARSKTAGGPVRVEMIAPAEVQGLSAEPLILEPGHAEGVMRIHSGEVLTCPSEARILLRASTMVGGDPATAETTLAIVRETTSR